MPSPPEIDPVTLQLAIRRDRAACQRLVERYQHVVFSAASRVLGRGSPEVRDVAQETFLRAFHHLAGFDPGELYARLSTWLAVLATRVAIDHARRHRPVVSLDALRHAPDPAADDPGERLDEARRRERLAHAMDRLSPEQRATVVLRSEHELSLEDIAHELGVEVGTIKSRLNRARQALLEAVGEHEGRRNQHG